MRKGNSKSPLQPSEVAPVMKAVRELVPMDVPLTYGHGHSLKHVPNFRLKSQTNEIEWCVDIYRGHFYHVTVGGSSEICKTIPILVSHLWRMLGRD